MNEIKFSQLKPGDSFEFIFHLASRGPKRRCIKLSERWYQANGRTRFVLWPSAQVYPFLSTDLTHN